MKAKIRNLFLRFGGVVAVMALFVATASVSSTCFYTAYQPDVPEGL